MTIIDVVEKLTGPVEPVGETRSDGRRLRNLQEKISLTASLLSEIVDASGYADRVEYSMQAIGKEAKEFLNAAREQLEDLK